MKPVKAWAVVMPSGKIRDVEGLCVFATNGEWVKKYQRDSYVVVRVEIREVQTRKAVARDE